MMAATLWAGDDALLSHRAAGVLHGLDGVTADRLEVTAPKRLRLGVVIAHRAPPFPAIDRNVVAGIAVTSPTRTLIDLAAVLGTNELELALEDALRRGLTSRARIGYRLHELEGPGRGGCAALRSLLEDGRGRPHSGSAPEVRLRRLITLAGLPTPVPQHQIRQSGRLIARVDLAYPDFQIAIEYDSERCTRGGAAGRPIWSAEAGSPRWAGRSSMSPRRSWWPAPRRRSPHSGRSSSAGQQLTTIIDKLRLS
jgi:hypothetical protein